MTDTTERTVSRRSLLRGGTVLGLSAVTTTGFAPGAAATRPPGPLDLDYRPSQATGWGATSTIGGHTASTAFMHDDRPYELALLPFGQSGDPHPVYEDEPADPAVDFKRVLAEAFGAYYSFRYAGLEGNRKLRVESYSAYVRQAAEVRYGADLYVVYSPDRGRGGPAVQDDLHWIQIARSSGPPLDNRGRANPFALTGGLTSIHGHAVCNFYDRPTVHGLGGPTPVPQQFLAETFIARDTGIRDTAGKAIVTILGGLKWGWSLAEIGPQPASTT